MRHQLALGAVLVVAVGVRAINIWQTSRLPIATYQFQWPESDMTANVAWSDRILDGDVLTRRGANPFTSWMRDIAPKETWERWWGGAVYYQAPLYAYALAAIRLAGDGFGRIAGVQALLGVLNVALVFLLARRLFDFPAAIIAALIAAVYGPFLLHETLLLRDLVGITTSLLVVWALVRCADGAPAGRWFGAGLLLALAILARETTLLFVPFVALWVMSTAPRRPGARWLVAGCILGLVPLVTRNVVVGVSPWALSNRTLEVVALGHAAGNSPVGVVFQPAARAVLRGADGDVGTAVQLAIGSYDGHWSLLVRSELAKLAAVFSSFEGMDNVDWYYFVDRLPVLRYSLHFGPVLALGVLGLVLAGRGSAAERIVRYFLLSAAAGLVSFTVVGRYRLPAIAVLLPYAGLALAWMGRTAAQHRWRALAMGAATVLGVAAVSSALLHSLAAHLRYRPTEFIKAAQVYEARGDHQRVLEELGDALRTAYAGPDEPRLPPSYRDIAADYVQVAHDVGRDAEAGVALRGLAARYPADTELREMAQRAARDIRDHGQPAVSRRDGAVSRGAEPAP